ncbi:breast cancer anti-estrogen resistance protein 3 homolog isoform X1 [Anopheles darlingi]|uniref:breast cancer anti-estrogen resistance protein 3 homolog isoform X1 n=2 Tax=Anopheles darlingi TaxID=43151 RepID=UPI00210020EE|nr:breast cancer anti-estrogen resistance protein 3 homolog isoform X1 [Anopheles darlingi]XP_049529799.1 breast cancer anti-estrogen resistance protein 3 homolog isoform X1 [Anopheles darlingi]XP_049529800.1 breast cancer anti-estrogen resistance protein 3 homolog isoform X1 [Anopheles darlingi]
MGKTTSKLDKRRSQSISWSYKFGTVSRRKKHAAQVASALPHMETAGWLQRLDLPEYRDNFKGYGGVEEMLFLTESDVKKLGIRNNAHRARIVSSLVALRENLVQEVNANANKRNGAGDNNGGEDVVYRDRTRMRHSVAVPERARKCNKAPSGSGSNNNSSNGGATEGDSDYACLTPANTKQSKSCGDLLDMETTPDGGNEAVALKKALEWELSLDSRDLRSHAWYHGPIPRQRAEEIVQQEGDFLVRDCVSQPGNYVLTCKTKGPTLHFVINKLLLQPETVYERVQYQFEDDAYDTVPDLITFYVGSGKAISAASGARIQFPCNRTYPLSYYAGKFPQNNGPHGIRGPSPLNSPSPVPSSPGFRYNPYTQQTNSYRSPMSSPPRTKRETPPRLPSKKQRSQSLTPLHGAQGVQQRYCSADGVIGGPVDGKAGATTGSSRPTRMVDGGGEKCNSADGVIHSDTVNGARSSTGEEKSSSADGVVKPQSIPQRPNSTDPAAAAAAHKGSTHSLARSASLRSSHGKLGSRASSINKEPSEHSLSPCIEQQQFGENEEEHVRPPSPPPKPIRGGGGGTLQRHESFKDSDTSTAQAGSHGRGALSSYHPSGSDSGNGSGDSAQSSATGEDLAIPHRAGGVVLKNPRFIPTSLSSVTLRSHLEIDPVAAEEALLAMQIPIFEQTSRYDLENFNTLLLPFCDCKPLDSGTLNTFRMMLCESGPRVIANHLTRVDIGLILEKDESRKDDPLNCSGLELITLEQGKQYRADLIERTECMKLLVAVTILTCQSDLERAETLNKWIQIAVETKTALGNLFGFSAIMLGLSMPQIQKLESTWHTLRQKFTDSAFNFEAKLRPTLNSMNDCSNPQAPNTTIPHILPYVLVKDRTINDIFATPTSPCPTLVASCVTPWETITQDFGFSVLFAHLDAARSFINNLTLYRKNAQTILQDTSRYDPLMEDAFKTEFQMKFLWGSKGALVPAEERHAKFEHVLTVMAEKFCGDPSAG